MNDKALPRIYTPAELETRELILHVRKRKWRYLAIATVMGIYFFWFFKYKVLDYSSTATFIVNDRSLLANALGLEVISTDDNFRRIFELANSIQTQSHLIKKFNLIEHYGIDTTKEFYMQLAIAKIKSKILVSKTPYNTISVTVHDWHRYMAAQMANEIVTYIEKLNHDYYVDNIQKRLALSQGFMNQIEKDISHKSIQIDSLVNKLSALATSGKVNEQTSYQLLGQQQRLSEAIGGFSTTTNDMLNAQKMYALALQALNFQNFPTTTPVQEAMPAFRSTNYTAALYSLGAMFGICMLLVIQGYFYLNYGHYIQLFLTGK